ncbi:MAG: DUF927 domain-containing protein [Magnetococcales bacterium]|nr:DUF927 domain-containing protein [Magnetococcales bacterium]
MTVFHGHRATSAPSDRQKQSSSNNPYPRQIDTDAATIKAQTDIVALIGHHVELKPRGGEYWGCCPFHTESTPSFSVKPDSREWYCFGCGAGGSVIDFVMRQQGISFQEAVAFLAGDDVARASTPRAAPSTASVGKKDPWVPIIPIPDDTPEPPHHYKMGAPSMRWTYRDTEGRALFHVCRFDRPKGGKEVLPLTFCQGQDGRRQWRWKGVPTPRPLYGLDRLAARPDAPVVVTEGEKAADAVAAIFPDWVAVTSPNGAGSADKADWSALVGRDVILWPDNDEAGLQYADAVTDTLRKTGAASVRWLRLDAFVNLPGLPARDELPTGWDAADAVTEGGNLATGIAFTEDPANLMQPRRAHAESMAEFDADMKATEQGKAEREDREKARRGFPFEVVERVKGRRSGVYFLPPADGDEQPEPVWLCDPLHVTARTRDNGQNNHGRLLEFDDPDGHHHAWAMPMSLLAGDGSELRSILLSKGLSLSTLRKGRDLLADYLQRARPDAVARCVERVGWHGGAFVLPGRTIGENSERVLLQTGDAEQSGFESSGTLEEWQREVAAKCAGNSRLVFAVSTAFASPLLDLAGAESGGFHFVGQSSNGKTTSLAAAVSVWGGLDACNAGAPRQTGWKVWPRSTTIPCCAWTSWRKSPPSRPGKLPICWPTARARPAPAVTDPPGARQPGECSFCLRAKSDWPNTCARRERASGPARRCGLWIFPPTLGAGMDCSRSCTAVRMGRPSHDN